MEDCEISLFSGASSRQGSNILFVLHWAKCPISHFLSPEQVPLPQIYLLDHQRPQITSGQDLPIHLASVVERARGLESDRPGFKF